MVILLPSNPIIIIPMELSHNIEKLDLKLPIMPKNTTQTGIINHSQVLGRTVLNVCKGVFCLSVYLYVNSGNVFIPVTIFL